MSRAHVPPVTDMDPDLKFLGGQWRTRRRILDPLDPLKDRSDSDERVDFLPSDPSN